MIVIEAACPGTSVIQPWPHSGFYEVYVHTNYYYCASQTCKHYNVMLQ